MDTIVWCITFFSKKISFTHWPAQASEGLPPKTKFIQGKSIEHKKIIFFAETTTQASSGRKQQQTTILQPAVVAAVYTSHKKTLSSFGEENKHRVLNRHTNRLLPK